MGLTNNVKLGLPHAAFSHIYLVISHKILAQLADYRVH